MDNRSINRSEMLGRVIRAVILIVVSLLLSVLSVSFAVHHMRLQFEDEFKGITDTKMQQVCDIVKMTVNGDELLGDPNYAAQKYSDVFALMLADTSTNDVSSESYGLFLYSDGQLTLLLSHGADSENNFAVKGREISQWLSSDNSSATITGENFESVLVPVADSSGRCVGVFEYKCSFGDLEFFGNKLESRILTAVIVAVASGVILFCIQLLIPKLISNARKGAQRL
ncbi:MAG: hypothetical protein J5685_11150 [Clostridiales bacterium]|nr:hypothetical protein [Clostridiales bacterium]